MYARTENSRISLDLVRVVCAARSRSFIIARLRARLAAAYSGWLA